MLMKVMKRIDDASKPDVIEMDTTLNVGDMVQIEYDWCDIISGKPNWKKAEGMFEVVDIACNMLVFPNLVWVTLTTEDKEFEERCHCNEFSAPESQILERMRGRQEKSVCCYNKCLSCKIETCWTGQIARRDGEEAYNEHLKMLSEATDV